MSDLQRVRTWADALISLHLDASWSFGFDNAKRRAGLCDYTRKRISVSRYLSARYDDDTNHQTLLHNTRRRDRDRTRPVGRRVSRGAPRAPAPTPDTTRLVCEVRAAIR